MLRHERDERGRRPVRGPLDVADVGRALRSERVRQGLSLRDVSRRLGVPEDRLRAAETGTIGRTDRLSALKTVRRFADLLELPGDRFALAVHEHWPAGPGSSTGSATARRDEPTATTPAVRTLPAPAPRGEIAFGSPFTPFDADFVTFDGSFDSIDSIDGAGGLAFTGDATGLAPAVPVATTRTAVRRPALPMPVRAAAAVLVLTVVAGGALLAVDRMHPSWLQGIGLTRSQASPAAAADPHGHAPAPAAKAADARGANASGANALRPAVTSPQAATVSAGPGPVRLTVSSVGGPCWVQVTAPTSAAPLYSGDVTAGSSRTFSVGRGAAVELGSGAGRVSVTSDRGSLSTYQPRVAPFTLTVQATS